MPENALLDTSVLINFLAIDRVDLLADHPQYKFSVTEHVRGEITTHYEDQFNRLENALEENLIEETRIESIEELALFAQLVSNPRLGLGECAAIAAAVKRDQALAIDDKAARNVALEIAPGLMLLDTQEIMVALIRGGRLPLGEADRIKDSWAAEHSFRLRIASFGDIV